MLPKTLLALSAAGLATAHYELLYPEWRGDSLDPPSGEEWEQWERPCAGVPYGEGNRTDWPTTGGSVQVTLGHDFNYAFINLGLEEDGDVLNFNVSLTPQPLNTTGSGTLCLRHLPLPDGVELPDGANASIQVVKVGGSGNAMYNCADIRLSSDAEALPESECENEDAEAYILEDQEAFNGTTSHDHDHGDDDDGEDHGDDDDESSDSDGDDEDAASMGAVSISAVVGAGMAALALNF